MEPDVTYDRKSRRENEEKEGKKKTKQDTH